MEKEKGNTPSTELVRELRDIATSDYVPTVDQKVANAAADRISSLEAALAAETLKRQQVEHERDCILESLAEAERWRNDYKIWWERDSTALGKVLDQLSHERTCKEDFRAQAATLRESLAGARELLERVNAATRDGLDVAHDSKLAVAIDAFLEKHL